MYKIFIRGCRGFLGSNFLKYASEKGYEVFDSEKVGLPVSMEDYAVINFAWHGTSGSLRGDYHVQIKNITDTLEFADEIAQRHCRLFINSGSIMEYEAIKNVAAEGKRPGINSLYSTAKLTADFMLKAYCAKQNVGYRNAVISNIYGPGEQSERFLNVILRKMLADEEIDLTAGNQMYDFIYIDDAMEAFLTVLEKGKNFENYYIGNSEQRKLKEFVLDIKHVTDSQSTLNFGAVPYNNIEISYEELNPSKLEEMGFTPKISFNEGIERTMKWIRETENMRDE